MFKKIIWFFTPSYKKRKIELERAMYILQKQNQSRMIFMELEVERKREEKAFNDWKTKVLRKKPKIERDKYFKKKGYIRHGR